MLTCVGKHVPSVCNYEGLQNGIDGKGLIMEQFASDTASNQDNFLLDKVTCFPLLNL